MLFTITILPLILPLLLLILYCNYYNNYYHCCIRMADIFRAVLLLNNPDLLEHLIVSVSSPPCYILVTILYYTLLYTHCIPKDHHTNP